MKKQTRLMALVLVFLSLFSTRAQAYVRPNGFVGQSGRVRVEQIKKFQATNNLNVTGQLNAETQRLLYDPTIQPKDYISRPPSQGYWLAINKSRRTLTLYKGSQVHSRYAVALGKSSTPTPSTNLAVIQNKAINPAWGGMGGRPIGANDPRNPLGERWMGLRIPGRYGFGIHGTIKPYQIGQYASNGCIRMFNYDIEKRLFPLVPVGAPVWIGTQDQLKSWGLLQTHASPSQEKPPAKPQPKPIPVSLRVNGEKVATDVAPYIEEGRTLVPLRFLSESLGYQVVWHPESRTVDILHKEGDHLKGVLVFEIASSRVRQVDPEFYQTLRDEDLASQSYLDLIRDHALFYNLDTPAVIRSGRTMVPVRFVAEFFGCQVGWEAATKTVLIEKETPKPQETPSPQEPQETQPEESPVPKERPAPLEDETPQEEASKGPDLVLEEESPSENKL
ncbi:MAG: stalk domain-containing protein [Tissierellia bacterium]|nr:stalk domain-containing protein [Tissierellia bacterium]